MERISTITDWTPIKKIEQELIPEEVNIWLGKSYVLSKAIKSVCKFFSVYVINQKMKPMSEEEIRVLNCKPGSMGMIRQTYLMGNNIPCVFARVVIPEHTLEQKREAFEQLGDKPIGETLLYNNPAVTRGDFEIKCFNDKLGEAVNLPAYLDCPLWARRSVFSFSGSPLLVTEVFLPGIYKHSENLIISHQMSQK